MFFLIRSVHPWHKLPEVVEVWNKQAPPLPYEKSLGTFNRVDLENGFEGYTIVEVEDGKEAEWTREQVQRLAPYGNIEGYKLQVDVVFRAQVPTN